MKTRKILALVTAIVMMLMLFAACGNSVTGTTGTTDDKASTASVSTASAPESVTINFMTNAGGRGDEAKRGQSNNVLQFIDDWNKANPGIQVKAIYITDADQANADKKMDILVASGDTTDVFELVNPNRYSKYISAGFIQPLDDLAKANNYDIQKVFGKYTIMYNDKSMAMPTNYSANITFFNRDMFDAAKLPYPVKGWTWDDYASYAKKLSDPSKGIYGSIMQTWEYYTYLMPMQYKVPAYKADGTFNYDAQEFAAYLKWFSEMGQSNAQPSWAEMNAKKYQYDSFMSGKFGMEVIGTWNIGNLSNLKNYPRTWKAGIAPPPVPADGKGNNMHIAGGAIAISNNAAHSKEAFKFAASLAENMYKILGSMPPRADMSPDDLKAYLKTTADQLTFDGITAEDLYNTIYDNGLGVCPEKIVGVASAQINAMIPREAEKYFMDPEKYPLETVVKTINDNANKLIEQEKAAK